ncbi:TIGR02453 family protein [bacterium]|nr:TIGR02453 family protein [bacterium]
MKEVLNFLSALKENNNKEWFAAHKKTYEKAKKQVDAFATELGQLMLKHDNIDPKAKIFRIYRDVRFSTDKTPYKTNFAGSYTRLSPALRGGYYFHISPEESFVGGGFWQPEKDDLQLIREQIQQDAQPLRQAINNSKFQAYFGELGGEQLKTSPKGFDKEDPAIDLLRYKSFVVMHKFEPDEVAAPDFAHAVNEGFMLMRPFFDVMSDYLTTNLNGESLI